MSYITNLEDAIHELVWAYADVLGWDNPYSVLDMLDDHYCCSAAKAYGNSLERNK
jgi:hypothetical protein